MRLLYKKGFTLIELLVVVSIIGVLASIIISSINEARLKAKQAKFTQTLTSLQTALELYYLDNGQYPISTDAGTWDHAGFDDDSDGIYFMDILHDGGYLSITEDPGLFPAVDGVEWNAGEAGLRYFKYDNAAWGYTCDQSSNYYVLQINFEGNNPNTGSGFSCVGRDWGGEADYTVGKFD